MLAAGKVYTRGLGNDVMMDALVTAIQRASLSQSKWQGLADPQMLFQLPWKAMDTEAMDTAWA